MNDGAAVPYCGFAHDDWLTMRSMGFAATALTMVFAANGALAAGTSPAEDDASSSEIIVTAVQVHGDVKTDLPPELVLDEAAIASYGASSVTDLLAAIGNQTQSTRARGGGGAPVVLLNGRRVSGFAEIRDLPSEAITRVEVLPEDVALRFGFSPGQRVVNFILKDNFSSSSGEIEYGEPSAGGSSTIELTSSYLSIGAKGRTNLTVQGDRSGALSENERNLIPAGVDQSGLRTLLPKRNNLKLNAVFNRSLSKDVTATLNLGHDIARTQSVLGVPQALIANPAATPFSVLRRFGQVHDTRIGASLDGQLAAFRWTVTGNHDRASVRTLTDRNIANPAQLSAIPRDSARSVSKVTNLIATADGALLRNWAGPVVIGLKAGFEDRAFSSQSLGSLGLVTGAVDRTEWNARGNIEFPLLRRDEGVGRALGDFSINGNLAWADLSDFGTVKGHGYGFNWSPVEGLSLFGNHSVAQAAPTPQQLSDPAIVTPNVAVFDFVRGTTVAAALISGGNPALLAEEQRDSSITVSYTPPSLKQLTMSGTYTRKRSDNLLSSFPALTADVERAFAGRVIRDASGSLLSIDQRPINFAGSSDDVVRWGVSFFKEFGPQQRRGAAMGGFGGRGGQRPAGGPPQGAGGGRGGGFGGFGRGGGGRWSLSAYHSVRINEEISLAPGLPVVDRLNGGATSGTGGTPLHVVDVEGGWFNKGIGFRLIAKWQSGTRISATPFAPELRFSDLGTLNLRAFLNFDQRKALVKRIPLLKGSRLALRVNNLFGDIQDVRDANGNRPLRYQPGYVDPSGRTWEISFRKLF